MFFSSIFVQIQKTQIHLKFTFLYEAKQLTSQSTGGVRVNPNWWLPLWDVFNLRNAEHTHTIPKLSLSLSLDVLRLLISRRHPNVEFFSANDAILILNRVYRIKHTPTQTRTKHKRTKWLETRFLLCSLWLPKNGNSIEFSIGEFGFIRRLTHRECDFQINFRRSFNLVSLR